MNLRIDLKQKPRNKTTNSIIHLRPINKDEYIPNKSTIFYIPQKRYYILRFNDHYTFSYWTLNSLDLKFESEFSKVNNIMQENYTKFLHESYFIFFLDNAYFSEIKYDCKNFLIKTAN